MLLPFFTGTFIATPSPEKKIAYKTFFVLKERLFVSVEVLRPSQPNGVMSSAVSLPSHTFTGQA